MNKPPLLTDERIYRALYPEEKGQWLVGQNTDDEAYEPSRSIARAQLDSDYQWHLSELNKLKEQYKKDIDNIAKNHELCLKDELKRIFEKIDALIKDYFAMSWGEFSIKYPSIKRGRYPGDEIKSGLQQLKKEELEG